MVELSNHQVQDILDDMGMIDENGNCPYTAEEIFKASVEYAKEKMIDKACECVIKIHNWPTQYEDFAKFQEEFIKAFREAMEE